MNDKNRCALRQIGMCRRAGALIFGTNMTVEAIRSPSKPFLVLFTLDASDNTQKKLKDACAYHGVPLASLADEIDGEMLAKAIGKTGSVSSVAITNEGLAKTITNVNYVNDTEKTETVDPKRSAGGATI